MEGYFDRHGGKTILIGRFIGLVRALAPFVAGSSGLAYRRFIPFSIVGTGLWATAFCVLGYVFWRSFDQVANVAGQAVFAFGVVASVAFGIVVAWRRLRQPEERARLRAWVDRQGERPLLRPLFAIAAAGLAAWRPPRLRFLWGRLTPGELGLELTTSLAIGGVGMYFFVLFAVVLAQDPGPTALDNQWFDLVDKLHSSMGIDIAKVVSELGALPTVIGLVVGTSIVLASRRPADRAGGAGGRLCGNRPRRAPRQGWNRPAAAGAARPCTAWAPAIRAGTPPTPRPGWRRGRLSRGAGASRAAPPSSSWP